ncbi:hypothetical protein L2E82_44976 [Cichorium intybus]|uniref:Uncharacterized protein n=1 Tax=Cichorium intybus TaxID=13427 RepID=A0ACB8ZSK5_CICIN|nr:hypothetical protein L2E82_44976 [Cichorium intybus]
MTGNLQSVNESLNQCDLFQFSSCSLGNNQSVTRDFPVFEYLILIENSQSSIFFLNPRYGAITTASSSQIGTVDILKAFLDDPWLIRDGKRTVQILVPKIDVTPPPPQMTVTPNVVVVDGSREDVAEEMLWSPFAKIWWVDLPHLGVKSNRFDAYDAVKDKNKVGLAHFNTGFKVEVERKKMVGVID